MHEITGFALQSPFSNPVYTYHASGTLVNGAPLICNDDQIDNCVKECARMFQPIDQQSCVAAVEAKWAPYSQCFTADSTVLVRGSPAPVRMCDVQVGHFVLDRDMQYVEVIDWLHREEDVRTEFLRINTSSGRVLTCTPDHLVYDPHQEQYVRACSAKSLQTVYIDGSLVSTEILHKESNESFGIYAPLTRSGSLLVDGINSSCYASPSELPLEVTHSMGQIAMYPYRESRLGGVVPIDTYCRTLYGVFAVA
jgi:hypothetical protein